MPAASLKQNTSPALTPLHALLQRLDQQQIAYCQFTGNYRLSDMLRGEAELNMLVDRGNTQQLAQTLSDCGFKRFSSASRHNDTAVEEYLALDAASGKLVHLNVYYQLLGGAPFLKDYRLPLEQQILASRVYRARENIYSIEPHMEMLLFILRCALRVRGRDKLYERLSKHFFDSATLAELHWLQSRTEPQKVQRLAAAIFGEQAAVALAQLLTTEQPTLRQLQEFRRNATATLRLYRTYSPLQALLRRSGNAMRWRCASLQRRYLATPVPVRRVSAGGGLLIALMGCDGSGKSTHLHAVQRWLGSEMDILPIYFGSGDGPASLLRWPLKLVADTLRKSPNYQSSRYKVETPSTNVETIDPASKRRAPTRSRMLAKALWALTLSLEKRGKLRRATAARNRGMVVICDRYPQNQVMGFNDGPLLNAWQNHSSGLLRALARWEGAPYRAAEAYPPDLVIKLDLTAEVAVARKPEMSLEECNRRIAVIEGLAYPAATQTLLLDATEPLETVSFKLKDNIWSKF